VVVAVTRRASLPSLADRQAQAEARAVAEQRCQQLAAARADLESRLASVEARDGALQQGVLHLEALGLRATRDLADARAQRDDAAAARDAAAAELAAEAVGRGRAESSLRHLRLDYDQV